MPQRFAGNGTPVCAAATDFGITLYQRNFLFMFGAIHGGTLARGATANNNDVKLVCRTHVIL